MACNFTSVWGLNYEVGKETQYCILADYPAIGRCSGGLLGTTSGLHFLINSAARWVPGLDIASVSGGWRGLT